MGRQLRHVGSNLLQVFLCVERVREVRCEVGVRRRGVGHQG